MENPNISDGDPVAHEVQVDLHMLRPLTLSQYMSVLLVSGLWSSAKNCRSQDASATPLVTARYSASALERETTGCRLDD